MDVKGTYNWHDPFTATKLCLDLKELEKLKRALRVRASRAEGLEKPIA
jgi:hypothetical protein